MKILGSLFSFNGTNSYLNVNIVYFKQRNSKRHLLVLHLAQRGDVGERPDQGLVLAEVAQISIGRIDLPVLRRQVRLEDVLRPEHTLALGALDFGSLAVDQGHVSAVVELGREDLRANGALDVDAQVESLDVLPERVARAERAVAGGALVLGRPLAIGSSG